MEVRSVEAIIRALNEAQVRYLVVGGLAVVAHGYGRLTFDVDLVIGLDPDNIARAFDALASIDYHPAVPITAQQFADREMRDSWREEKGMVVLKFWSDLHRRTPLDVFVYEPFDFAAEHARARWEKVLGRIVAPVLDYESLLVMKQEAGRDKDLLDIEALRKLDPHR